MSIRKSHFYIPDTLEIDLYTNLKRDVFRHYGQLRTYIPPPYNQTVYLPLGWTRTRYGGRRLWFLAPCCQRKTSKLYVDFGRIGCRVCFDIKYPCQFAKGNAFKERTMIWHKLSRLENQNRLLWYGSEPTQFGRYRNKLHSVRDELNTAVWEEHQRLRFQIDLNNAVLTRA